MTKRKSHLDPVSGAAAAEREEEFFSEKCPEPDIVLPDDEPRPVELSEFRELEVRVLSQPWSHYVNFCVIGRDLAGKWWGVDQITFRPLVELAEGSPLHRSFALAPTAVKGLLEQLVALGYMNPQVQSAAGELNATRTHLADMRALVAQALENEDLRPRKGL